MTYYGNFNSSGKTLGDDTKTFVFVYGSLRKGFVNNSLLQQGGHFKKARRVLDEDYNWFQTSKYYQMLSAGGFPIVYKAVKEPVTKTECMRMRRLYRPIKGEVYEVTAFLLQGALDRLEGHPTWYKRELVDVVGLKEAAPESKGKAWMYIMTRGHARESNDYSLQNKGGMYDWGMSSCTGLLKPKNTS